MTLTAPSEARSTRSVLESLAGRVPGIALVLVVAAGATALSHLVGLGSGPVLGIVVGIVVGLFVGPRRGLSSGLKWSATYPLQTAVVLLGAELPLAAVATQGLRSLPGILITISGCLLVAQLLGRRLGIDRRLRALVGVGTSICGASAIAAITPVIDAERTEVGYAVTTIFLFNIAAVLVFPTLGHALGLSNHSFGVFSGTAVNDLSSVVATAGLYSASSLHTAVIVKLTRTLMIVPICLILGRLFAAPTVSEEREAEALSRRIPGALRYVPLFLMAFIALAALRGIGVIPAAWSGTVSESATLLITVALSAVGLSVDLGALKRAGLRPLALGAVLWLVVSLLSLSCQAVGLL